MNEGLAPTAFSLNFSQTLRYRSLIINYYQPAPELQPALNKHRVLHCIYQQYINVYPIQ